MLFMLIVKASENSELGKRPPDGLMKAMDDYNDALDNAGIKLMAKGIQPTSNATRIYYDDKSQISKVVEGPFENVGEIIAGFFLIDVDSKEEALEWAMKMPDPQGYGQGQVEVRQLF